LKTYPATSLTISRTKAVRLLRRPFDREMRGLFSRGVVFYCQGKKEGHSAPISWSVSGLDIHFLAVTAATLNEKGL